MRSRRFAHALGRCLSVAAGLLLAASTAVADELVLKNGQKISGTIVGYENGMFRLETEFGFVLIRKDKVATIQVTAAGPAKPDKPTEAAKVPAVKPATVVAKPETRQAEPVRVPAPSAAPTRGEASSSALAPPSPPPPPVSRSLDNPPLATIQERIEGNNYINETCQFMLYKPPGWKVHEDVPRQTGSGVAALGTEDEQNLLLVDRQLWSGPPDLKADRGEVLLRKTYQEYQKLSESTVKLDGASAGRRTFRGVLDGVEWHGISVQVVRGRELFTIIGLTSAEYFEFQQAVLNKMISSFRFMLPAPPSVSSSASAKP